jgi:hypothetical protein
MKTRNAIVIAAAWAALGAVAQAPVVRAPAGDEIKAVYATPTDVAEGKRAAESVCKA